MKYFCIFLAIFMAHSTGLAHADHLQKYYVQGLQAYEAGRYDKAVEFYEKVVELDTNFAPVYNALGLAYDAMNGNMADIEWFFNIAVQIDPNYLEAYNNMCRIFYQAQEFEKAEAACLEVLRIRPGFGSAELSLAWVYLVGKNEPQRSIYYFNEVLKKVQKPMIYFGLGLAYSQNGDRALVLDTSMKLKSMGEQQLANQLESTLRTYVDTSNMLPPPGPVRLPQRQAGQVIGGAAPAEAETAEAPQPAPAGTMRVRLRGTLSPNQPVQAQQPAQSNTYGVQQDNRSAVERIREMQRMRQEGVTSRTYIPKGSGY